MKYNEVDGYGSVPKKKHRGLITAIAVFLIVLVTIGGIFCYNLMHSKNSIQLLLDYAFDYLESSITKGNYDSITGNFSVQMKFQNSGDLDNEILAIFNKLDFSGDYGIDYNKNIMSLDFSSNYDDKDLIDVSLYTEYGKAYIYLDDLYDKYIDTSIDDYSQLFERNLDDYKTVVLGMEKALTQSLKEEYFTVEKVELDSEKVTKTTLDLTGDNYLEYTTNLVEILLNNKNFLESYARITNQEIDNVKEELKDIAQFDNDYDGKKYILYTKGIAFIRFDIVSENQQLIIKKNGANYDYEFYENDIVVYTGSVEISLKDDKSNILFSFYDKEEHLGLEVVFESFVEYGGTVEKKDVTNSIAYENLSYSDYLSIYSKLMKNEGLVKIIGELSKLMVSDENTSSSLIFSN